MRPTDLAPRELIEELVRLHRFDRDWLTIRPAPDDDNKYRVTIKDTCPTWISDLTNTGLERCEMLLLSRFFGDGPKVFIPTLRQVEVFEQVEVNLSAEEYTQPYEVMAVQLPPGRYLKFLYALVYKLDANPAIIITGLMTGRSLSLVGNQPNVITTIYGKRGYAMEHYLSKYDDSCTEEEKKVCNLALRVACNSFLALANFGSRMDMLYPKEVERDASLAREKSERGERARRRLALAARQVSFSQEVKLYREEKQAGEPGQPTGASMPCHWRRGHWAMTPCGPKHSERKRVFRAPVLVRADLFDGDTTNTSVTYKG